MKNTLRTDWKELTDKDEFKNITNILCKYYNIRNNSTDKTKSQLFREQIVKTENDNLTIYIRKFGFNEYRDRKSVV